MIGVKKCTKTRVGESKAKVVEAFKKRDSPTPAEIRQVRRAMTHDPRDAH